MESGLQLVIQFHGEMKAKRLNFSRGRQPKKASIIVDKKRQASFFIVTLSPPESIDFSLRWLDSKKKSYWGSAVGRPPQKLRIWAVDIHRAQEKNTIKTLRNRSQAFPVGPTTKSTSANIRKI